jgi:hypothetical protein
LLLFLFLFRFSFFLRSTLCLTLTLTLLVIVGLRSRSHLIILCTRYIIMISQYFPKFIKGLKNMNTSTSVKSSGFEKPQIFTIKSSIYQFIRTLHQVAFSFNSELIIAQFLVDFTHILINIVFYYFQNALKWL